MNYPVGGEIAVRLKGETVAHSFDEVVIDGKPCVVIERGPTSFLVLPLNPRFVRAYAETDRLDRLQSHYAAFADPKTAFEVQGTATLPP